MPGKRKITIATLTKLGADRLAELLLAGATGNKQLKEAIELAISAKQGPESLGASVRQLCVPKTSSADEFGAPIVAAWLGAISADWGTWPFARPRKGRRETDCQNLRLF